MSDLKFTLDRIYPENRFSVSPAGEITAARQILLDALLYDTVRFLTSTV